MRVLVNALSVSNFSGREVLRGHLSQLAVWTQGRHDFVVLHHPDGGDVRCDLGANVRWMRAPRLASHWIGRRCVELFMVPVWMRRLGADIHFSMAGTVIPTVRGPQVSMALNPWALVACTQRSPAEKAKGFLQRRAYRQAVRRAAMMAYGSDFMREAYRANAGRAEAFGETVYPAASAPAVRAAEAPSALSRERDRIVCVSVMAPHKGAETVVEAIDRLSRAHGIRASLHLVGPWPEASYERTIRELVRALGLDEQVHVEGQVSRERLYEHYRLATAFCLMSRCESFGIPLVEAQLFGTPAVASACCALPEVGGEGALYAQPGDAVACADALARLLRDPGEWRRRSEFALANSLRFRYEKTARPLLKMFEMKEGETG